ncbi:MAG: hypothetical protein ACJ76F_02480, partial [Bacteroidia bacterium]
FTMSFFCCERMRNSIRKKAKRKLNGDYTFTLYDDVQDIFEEDWINVLGEKNFFLSLDYLHVIQQLHQSSISFRYVIVYRDTLPVFISYFQIIDFTADVFGELLLDQVSDGKSKHARLFESYLDHNKKKVIMRLVTCGNNYISGEHGFAFADVLKREEAFGLLEQVISLIGKEEKLRGKISATLVKDFYQDHLPSKNKLTDDKFINFSVEPNMIIDIPEGVSSVQEYISLFSKKYRNRAKNIFKQGSQVTRKELNVEETLALKDKLYNLYMEVYSNAKFKLVQLHSDYFAEMKRAFPEQFRITGFFLNDKLLAFDSAFIPGEKEVEAHYIGVDYSKNKDFELYQNILYNLIDVALKTSHRRLNLGRTAAEIKSTVGARAHELICYIKPQNTVSKVVLTPFISYLQPTAWIPRNPFKEE